MCDEGTISMMNKSNIELFQTQKRKHIVFCDPKFDPKTNKKYSKNLKIQSRCP